MTLLLPEVFPYQLFKGNFYPLINLFIHNKGGLAKRKILALIDSGASMSIFQPDMAEKLGIKIESGKPISLQGIGGEIKGYVHTLTLEISQKTINCPIVFSRQYKVSINLLGRESFFHAFQITFNESKKQLSLL